VSFSRVAGWGGRRLVRGTMYTVFSGDLSPPPRRGKERKNHSIESNLFLRHGGTKTARLVIKENGANVRVN